MGENKFQRFLNRLKDKIEDLLHDALDWFQEEIKPDVLDFIDDNKDLAMKICLEIKDEMVDAINEEKRAEAIRRIGAELLKNIPNITFRKHWLGLLVEMVVAVLKSQGRL